MPTDNPRIQVMLDTETSVLLADFAAATNKRSMSSAAAELIKEALEMHEDMMFSELADKRFSTATKWIENSDDVWK